MHKKSFYKEKIQISLLCCTLLLMLQGCQKVSFSPELLQAQKLAGELLQEDILYTESGCPATTITLPQELSRDEAIRIALLNNKEISASLYDLGIAKTTLADALLFQNPLISVSTVHPFNGGTINWIDIEAQILNIPDLIQIPLRRKMHSTHLEAALYVFANKMIEIIVQTRQAYDKALYNQALIELLNDPLKKNSQNVGEKPLLKEYPKTLEKKSSFSTEITIRSLLKELTTALTELRVLMGVDEESFSLMKLSSSLDEEMTPLPQLAALIEWAECSHIDIIIAQKNIQYAIDSLAYEKTKPFDRVSVGTTYFKDFSGQQAGLGVYLAAAVPLYNQNQPRIDQAEFVIEKSKYELETKRNKLRASLTLAHTKIVLQKEIVELYEKELQRLVTELSPKKEISAPEREKKQQDYRELKNKALEARYQLLDLYTAMEKVAGKRLFFALKTIIPSCYKDQIKKDTVSYESTPS